SAGGDLSLRADQACPLTGQNADRCLLDDAGVAAVIELGIDNIKDPDSNQRGNNGLHLGKLPSESRCSANLVRSSGFKWDRARGFCPAPILDPQDSWVRSTRPCQHSWCVWAKPIKARIIKATATHPAQRSPSWLPLPGKL